LKRESYLEVAETRGKEHGRRVIRRLQSTTRLQGYLDWPSAAQVCRLVRTTRRQGQETVEVEYAITSVPRELAHADRLLEWWRGHWGIENREHYVRDVTFGEDHSRIRTGSAPQILAACRNAAISFLRLSGCTNIAAALRHHAYQPRKLFTKLGMIKK
jgi:predicted transposase YbfD/YdcC